MSICSICIQWREKHPCKFERDHVTRQISAHVLCTQRFTFVLKAGGLNSNGSDAIKLHLDFLVVLNFLHIFQQLFLVYLR